MSNHSRMSEEKQNVQYRTWNKGKGWCYRLGVLAVVTGGLLLALETANADTEQVPLAETVSPLANPLTAVSADLTLMKGNTGQEQPASMTLPGYGTADLGVKGSFTANTSDLITGNVIKIADLTQTSTEPGGALSNLVFAGAPVTLLDTKGNTVGTIQYEKGLNAVTLKVTNTVVDPVGGTTQSYTFTGSWMMRINYQTPSSASSLYPFSNTLSVTGRNYTFNFEKISSNAATTLSPDGFGIEVRATISNVNIPVYHADIPDNNVFADLQASGGTAGNVRGDVGLRRSFRASSESDVVGISGYIVPGTYYVSAADNKIQAVAGETSARRGYNYTIPFPSVNSGADLTLSELQAEATSTGIYYSKQSDGSYLVVNYVSPESMKLTDVQIELLTRSNVLAASSSDVEADVQATLDYYHGVLGSRSSFIHFYTGFNWADEYVANTLTARELDDNGNIIHGSIVATVPNAIAAAGQSVIKVHHEDEKGNALALVDTTAGWPAGNSTNMPATPARAITPLIIPGYTYSVLEGATAAADGSASVAYPAEGATKDVTYIYKADSQKVVYNVIDDTAGKNLEASAAFDNGGTGSNLNKSQSDLQAIADDYVSDGYEVISIDPIPSTFDNDASVDQVVNIHLKHARTKGTVSKDVARTIRYVYEDGSEAAPYKRDVVTFIRSFTRDDVTDEIITTGEWYAVGDDDTFDSVTSPLIEGYTADKDIVVEATVSGDSEHLEVIVTYKNEAEPATDPEDPEESEDPNVSGESSVSANPEEPANSVDPAALEEEPASNPISSISLISLPNSQPVAEAGKNKVLPRTGEENRNAITAGAITLGTALLAVVASMRRFKKH